MKYFEVSLELCPFSQDAADLLSAELAEIGFETFSETEQGLMAYVQQSAWDEEKMQEVIGNFLLPEVEIRYSVAEAPDEDWNQVWEEEGFQPVVVRVEASHGPSKGGVNGAEEAAGHSSSAQSEGSKPFPPPLEGQGEAPPSEGQGEALIVIHDVKHLDVPAAEYDIVITPRLAFGTGSHATTRLILKELACLDLRGKHVVDAGTGTGILSIMALKRGARSVLAYDIDEWSVENTKDNMLLNRIQTLSDSRLKGEKQEASPLGGGLEGSVVVLCGDSRVLEGQPKAELLMANINRNILLGDLPRFAASVEKGGWMILSGFYLDDVQSLADAAAQQGFSLKKVESEGEWAMMLLEADAFGG